MRICRRFYRLKPGANKKMFGAYLRQTNNPLFAILTSTLVRNDKKVYDQTRERLETGQ